VLLPVLREEAAARRPDSDRQYALTRVTKSLALTKIDKY
jgi:hypothetical protein